jgi:Ni,Fe-hydrogenase I small subunit
MGSFGMMATKAQHPSGGDKGPPTLFWLQCGACGGDSMALLGVHEPDIGELVRDLGLELLWHPSVSRTTPGAFRQMVDDILADRRPLDVLCVEGSIIRGPGGTGMFDTFGGAPKRDLATALARKAGVVVAVGTCAGFGASVRRARWRRPGCSSSAGSGAASSGRRSRGARACR